MRDPNRTPIGDVRAKDKIVNTFLRKKKSSDGVAEISVNYTDFYKNIRQMKVGSDGKVASDRITQESPAFQRKVLNNLIEKTGSRKGKSLAIRADDWDRIFRKSS